MVFVDVSSENEIEVLYTRSTYFLVSIDCVSFSSIPQTLKLDVPFTTDPSFMAEGFNNYFSEVDTLLAGKTKDSKKKTF